MSKRVIVYGTASEAALVRTIEELRRENAALRADRDRLDFLGTLTGSGWAALHLDRKGLNDEWFLTRNQIDRRMATEPKT